MVGRNVLAGLLVLLNLYLAVSLIWGDHGLLSHIELQARHDNLEVSLDALDVKSREVSQGIRLMESDRAYQERMVREQMNYVREDEVVYVFPATDTATVMSGSEAENAQ